MSDRQSRLDAVIGRFRESLYLPDPGIVEVTLGTVAANLMQGEPVWVLLTGPPSSGKTEILNSLSLLPDMYPVSTLTEAALLSGTKDKERAKGAKGGLLEQIGEFGILVVKDLTSILSMNRDKRQGVLAALRELYDGEWNRHLGVDGGRNLSWKGKLGLIGGVTSEIDKHHAVMSAMGQRFALYRLPKLDPAEQARRAIDRASAGKEMRDELAQAVRGLFPDLRCSDSPELSEPDCKWMIALACFVATCRSAVDRDNYFRAVDLVHDPEGPARLTKLLTQLLFGLRAIGVCSPRDKQLIIKVGFDCIPPLRSLALRSLWGASKSLTIAEIRVGTPYPEQTVRRALEDLECHAVIVSEKPSKAGLADRWSIAPTWRKQLNVACESVPEMFPLLV